MQPLMKVVFGHVKPAFKAMLVMGSLLSLSGCLLTSPFNDQTFASTTTAVPVQAWTTTANQNVKVECAPSTRFGPYWLNPDPNWVLVDNLTSSENGMLDPLGNRIFSAGASMVIPQGCWYANNSNGYRYAALRVFTGNNFFSSFNEDGLECLGQMIGDKTNWFGWNNSCINKTSDGSKSDYLIIKAE